jgi:hypothetical protein
MANMEDQSQRFQIRGSPAFFKSVDKWRREQPDLPSRAEAFRRLVEQALAANRPKRRKSKE